MLESQTPILKNLKNTSLLPQPMGRARSPDRASEASLELVGLLRAKALGCTEATGLTPYDPESLLQSAGGSSHDHMARECDMATGRKVMLISVSGCTGGRAGEPPNTLRSQLWGNSSQVLPWAAGFFTSSVKWEQ